MTTVWRRTRGTDGRVAIWTGEDDLPFDAPLDHLKRLKFHSSLGYPKIVDERTVSITLPTRTRTDSNGVLVTSKTVYTQTYTLFAHGRPGQPWVLGSFNIGGQKVAATGSVPVYQPTKPGNRSTYARWVTIGADGQNVYAYEYTALARNETTGVTGFPVPAVTIPITIWVTDEILEDGVTPTDPEVSDVSSRVTPTRVVFDRGKFDSNHRYLRTAPGITPMSTMLSGPSIALARNSQFYGVTWRYECGGYVVRSPPYEYFVNSQPQTMNPPSDVSNIPTPFAL